MSVSFNGGIDYTKWQPIANTTLYNGNEVYNDDIIYQNTPTEDTFVSTTNNGCTDGKDDGKIGFFSAIGNAIKGAGKTVVNCVKGMFTNSEGKFSLGKTLLSIGTAALCIAVPAVGVAACAIGGTMGAIQVGKGIYNAATAETDAEAKEAWQNIGGGAITVAGSVAGAKAGIKAVKATSTAGTNGASALSQLDDSATMMQKVSALGKDMASSTANRINSIKTSAGNYLEALKIKNLEKKVSKFEGENALTDKQLQTANRLQYRKQFATDETNAALEKLNNVSDSISKTAQNAMEGLKHPIQTGQNVVNSKTGQSILNAIKHPIKTAKNIPSNLSKGAQSVVEAIKTTDSSYAQLVQKYGYENVAEVLKLFGGYTVANQAI